MVVFAAISALRFRHHLAKALIAGTAIAAVLGESGCGFNPDPTELNVHVTIRNDLRVPVHLYNCKSWDVKCRVITDDAGVLQPAHDLSGVYTQIGVPNPLLVRSSGGKRIGCLPLRYNSSRELPAVVLVSDASPC